MIPRSFDVLSSSSDYGVLQGTDMAKSGGWQSEDEVGNLSDRKAKLVRPTIS